MERDVARLGYAVAADDRGDLALRDGSATRSPSGCTSTGEKVAAGEVDDPTFFFRCWEPSDFEADHTDPKVWAEANPSLGAFLHAEDFAVRGRIDR